jgi:hypothetical protein
MGAVFQRNVLLHFRPQNALRALADRSVIRDLCQQLWWRWRTSTIDEAHERRRLVSLSPLGSHVILYLLFRPQKCVHERCIHGKSNRLDIRD